MDGETTVLGYQSGVARFSLHANSGTLAVTDLRFSGQLESQPIVTTVSGTASFVVKISGDVLSSSLIASSGHGENQSVKGAHVTDDPDIWFKTDVTVKCSGDSLTLISDAVQARDEFERVSLT